MIELLQSLLQDAANPEQAKAMAAYMKGRFAYFGIKKPERAALSKEWIAEAKNLPWEEVEALVRALWAMPEREYQYVALDLMMKLPKKAPREAIELYRFCIVEKSWWDTVDLIATNLVGTHFRRFPEDREKLVAAWRDDQNMWLVRTTLLFQLKYKDETDAELLASLIRQHAGWKEFFIEKAIGWTLRQYGKYNPAWVLDFVDNNTLAPLSRREALKHLK